MATDTAAEPAGVRLVVRRRTVLAYAACFVIGFVLAQWALDRFDSPFQAAADKIGPKFAYFAAHKDAYDVIFVGSSRVMNQLSPRRFDEEMAVAGHPCRSFNFGYAGMYLPECSYLLDRILALHPARLRLVVFELSNPAPRHEEDGISDREVYWHRPTPTLLACSAILGDTASPLTRAERCYQLARQFGLLARCVCHVGDGPRRVRSLSDRRARAKKSVSKDVLGPEGDGFVPLTTFLGGDLDGVTKKGGGKKDAEGFNALVEALRHGGTDDHSPGAAEVPAAAVAFGGRLLRDTLASRVRTLRHQGIAPVFFIGPGITREQTFLDLHADGTLPELFAFNDPAANPELYDPKVRADRYHLNAAGADLLTRKLAAAVSARGPDAP